PGDHGDPDTIEDAEAFLRYNADEAHRRMTAFVSGIAAHGDALPEQPWCLDDWPVRLTTDEARALVAELRGLAARYRRESGDPDPRPGTERAVFQFQLLPDEQR
ncbi:MAG: hypothetical protein ACRDVG_00305, partial [Jatrophihabitantaceae bacterium]